jgi:riboflavin synthase
MFTGIIEELGTITAIEQQPDAIRLTVKGPLATSDVSRGDSISVSGTCLTAVEIDRAAGTFTADVMNETLRLTSLQGIKVGDRVNLERAMTAATRFGGHVVQGHVDGFGHILSIEPSDNWTWVRISVPAELMKYVVLKGSITLDGVSLTVNEVGDADGTSSNQNGSYVGVSLIPETLALTTFGVKQPSDRVNVEADVMAKHIERLLEARGI